MSEVMRMRLGSLALVLVWTANSCSSGRGSSSGNAQASGGEAGEGGGLNGDAGAPPSHGGADSGGDADGGAGSAAECAEGSTRHSSAPCGLNQRGSLDERCVDGEWLSGCSDPDECVDGESRNGEVGCGSNGVIVEACERGTWQERSECNDAPECSGTATRSGTTSCGLNARGKLEQQCERGFWRDTSECSDPDECVDGDAVADGCLGGAGTLERSCVNGAWAAVCSLDVTLRVSASASGVESNGASGRASVSSDGRYVAFESVATNLVAGDTNGLSDVFVRDLVLGTTLRASVSSEGAEGDGGSFEPSISADGRYVAFSSVASNFADDDTNGYSDVFVRDLASGTTRLVSVAVAGPANSSSIQPAVSPNGRYVAFTSQANNLVSGDVSAYNDIFVRDLATSTTWCASVNLTATRSTGSSYGPSISNAGVVAFESSASDLVSDDTNAKYDVFVRDHAAATTRRVSLADVAEQADEASWGAAISADGRYVAFESSADLSGLANPGTAVYVRDLSRGETRQVSVNDAGEAGNGNASSASISADGAVVAFMSTATNLVSADTNFGREIFVRDLRAATTRSASVTLAAFPDASWLLEPSLSANGRVVAFESSGALLVSGDTNEALDVFLAPVP